MMSLHAHESARPHVGTRHPLRAYDLNSPRAKARLIVLSLLADGRLDDRELEVLDRQGIFAALGLDREDFVQVMYDFCSDVADMLPADQGSFHLTPLTLAGLFGEVDEHGECEKLLRLITDVISSDGQLSTAEESLFISALEAWTPLLAKVTPASPEVHYR